MTKIYKPEMLTESLKTIVSTFNSKDSTIPMPNDEVLATIAESFSIKLNEAVEAGKHEAEVQYNESLQANLLKLDKEFTTVTERVTNFIKKWDDTVSNKINGTFKNFNERVNKTIANKKLFVEVLSQYLDGTIAEFLPAKEVIDSEQIRRSKLFYESIRKAVLVNDDDVKQVIEGKLTELDTHSRQLKESLDAALTTKLELKAQVNQLTKEKLVAESIAKLDNKVVKDLVIEKTNSLTLDEVTSKIEEIITESTAEFERNRRIRRDARKEEVVTERVQKVRPAAKPISAPDGTMAMYVENFQNIVKK